MIMSQYITTSLLLQCEHWVLLTKMNVNDSKVSNTHSIIIIISFVIIIHPFPRTSSSVTHVTGARHAGHSGTIIRALHCIRSMEGSIDTGIKELIKILHHGLFVLQ